MLGQPGYRARLEALIGCANLVKVSEDDLRALEPEAEPLVTAASWVERGPELVVVTHGAGGATAVGPGAAPLHVPARRVETVDTIGAGDAFTAGLLTFLAECGALRVGGCAALELQEVAAALVFASDVAAATCARAGADPPWRVELPGAFVSGSNDWRRT
jgi:fructokinase